MSGGDVDPALWFILVGMLLILACMAVVRWCA